MARTLRPLRGRRSGASVYSTSPASTDDPDPPQAARCHLPAAQLTLRRALPALATAALVLAVAGSSAARRPAWRNRHPRRRLGLAPAAHCQRLRALVNGHLTAEGPSGCQPTHGYGAASCRLAEACSVVIEMGSSNDKIEVARSAAGAAHRLPRLWVGQADRQRRVGHLLSAGHPRNRCIGNGGDDVCISGPGQHRLRRRTRGRLLRDQQRQRRLLGRPGAGRLR